MKVILLKDVAKIGRRFDVVTVPDGFALNKLIPKNMAEAATPESIKRLENLSSKSAHDREIANTAFAEVLASLKDVQVTVNVDTNVEGRMFQALKVGAIIDAVKLATGFQLDAEQIVMKTPIKLSGEHVIELMSGDMQGSAQLNLISSVK